MQCVLFWILLNCFCTGTSPRQDVHSSAADGAVSVGFSAVQDLLELFISGPLGFYPHLQEKNGCERYFISLPHAAFCLCSCRSRPRS